MKKILLGLSVLSVLLFASCDKETNVAKAYEYTLDEEFVDNSLGWEEFEKSDLKVFVNPKINGTLVIDNKGTKTHYDSQEAKLGTTDNFEIETSFSFEKGDTPVNYSGVIWNHTAPNKFMLFSLKGEEFIIVNSVKSTSYKKPLYSGSIDVTTPPVYKLTVQKSDTTLTFRVNNTIVKQIKATDLSSGKVGIFNRGNSARFHYLRVSKE